MERDIAIKKISERFKIPEKDIINLLEKPAGRKKTTIEKVKPVAEIKIKKLLSAYGHKYLFTLQDYESLLVKMEECLEQIKYHGKEVGNSCAESDSWHDNFSYEEGLRQQGVWQTRYRHLQKIKDNSEIINRSSGKNINIGTKVEMEVNGNILIKRVGSYMTFSDDDLSYASPLAQAIIGKKTGEEVKCLLNNEPTLIKIISCQ
jgi:transcription elongation GreA/GreB family factor